MASVFFTKYFCEKKPRHKVIFLRYFFHKRVFYEKISYNIEYPISENFFTKYTCLTYRGLLPNLWLDSMYTGLLPNHP